LNTAIVLEARAYDDDNRAGAAISIERIQPNCSNIYAISYSMEKIIQIGQLIREHLGGPTYADGHFPADRGRPSLFMQFGRGIVKHDLRIGIAPKAVTLTARIETQQGAKLIEELERRRLGNIDRSDFLTTLTYEVKTSKVAKALRIPWPKKRSQEALNNLGRELKGRLGPGISWLPRI
jgi:hypothetical protein